MDDQTRKNGLPAPLAMLLLVACIALLPRVSAAASTDTETTDALTTDETGTDSTTKAASGCELTMGWEPWEPYQYIDENNQLVGFDIDLINAIASAMGCTVRFKELVWARGLVETEAGVIDMLAHADYTDERNTWAHYSEPYRDSSQVLYVRKGESDKYPITSLKDAAKSGFRIGVGRGVYSGEDLESCLTTPELKKQIYYIPTVEIQQYNILQAGHIDGYIRSITAIDSLRNTLGEDLNLEIHPLPILTSKQHVIFSRKSVDRALVEEFNQSLNLIIERGVYDEIENRYLN